MEREAEMIYDDLSKECDKMNKTGSILSEIVCGTEYRRIHCTTDVHIRSKYLRLIGNMYIDWLLYGED